MVLDEITTRMEVYRCDHLSVRTKYQGDPNRISKELTLIKDRRIHLLLFFFDSHHTKDQDFYALKEFQEFTNIIPLIGKGDSFEKAELKKVRRSIVQRAFELGVKFFDVVSTLDDIQCEN